MKSVIRFFKGLPTTFRIYYGICWLLLLVIIVEFVCKMENALALTLFLTCFFVIISTAISIILFFYSFIFTEKARQFHVMALLLFFQPSSILCLLVLWSLLF